MSITQALAEDDAVAAMRFHGERHQAAAHQYALHLAQQRGEIGLIDHGVGGENEIGAGLRSIAQALHHVGDLELRIKPGGTRPFDHAR